MPGPDFWGVHILAPARCLTVQQSHRSHVNYTCNGTAYWFNHAAVPPLALNMRHSSCT